MNSIRDYFVHIINAVTGRTAKHIDDYRFYLELLKEEIEFLHTKLEVAERKLGEQTAAKIKKATPVIKSAPVKKAVVKKAASTKTSGK